MKKLIFNLLLFIILFAFSCSDDPIPSPSGDCRLAKIIYEGDGERFERIFKYNTEGLLIEYNMWNIGAPGTVCKTVLAYDNQKRLINRVELCGNKPLFEVKYSYKTPYNLEGIYKDYLSDNDGSILLYYNSEGQIDSSLWTYNDKDIATNDSTISRFNYENGNLITGVDTDEPCCGIYTFSESLYDNGINPYNLLKKSSNNFGFISIGNFFPTGGVLSSLNNCLKYKWTSEYRQAPDDPQTYLLKSVNLEFLYEYYENSLYPKVIRSSNNGVLGSTKATFIYEACK